jgi:hypothetical protein|tara:strand:+ start:1714 stop:1953 length:240 start_codon:yes stop_codon:yes gene_type:complete
MDDALDGLSEFGDFILLDSLRMIMENKSMRYEYINMDDVPLREKLRDIDEMVKYAESNELYEECTVLIDMKNQIIENNK